VIVELAPDDCVPTWIPADASTTTSRRVARASRVLIACEVENRVSSRLIFVPSC
jgi:hypothetical protein